MKVFTKMVDGVGIIVKILLFDAFTALSSNIGRFHEIFEFLTELKAKNIYEALDTGIYERSFLAIKL